MTAAIDTHVNTVRVAQHGHTLVVEPVVDELRVDFRTVVHDAARGGSGPPIRRRLASLLSIGCEAMLAPAGLKPLVKEALKQLGYEVRDDGRDCDSRLVGLRRPLLDGPSLDRRDRFWELLRNERRLVRYDPQSVSPARLIAQIAKAWPRLRIVCAVTRVEECHQLWRRLASMLPEEWIHAINLLPNLDRRARVVIGTYAFLGGSEADLHNRDVLFALNPVEMLTNVDGRLTLRDADQSRLFGFLPIGQRFTAREHDLLIAWYGQNEHVIPRHGKVARPVAALFLPFFGGPQVGQYDSTCELLRHGIGNHPTRNRRVARFAQALASGDAESIRQIMPLSNVEQLLSQCGPSPRVGVYAANIEQAAHLYGWLRSWKLVCGKTYNLDGMRPQQAELIRIAQNQPNRAGKGLIITPSGLPRVRTCDILIRADGGVGSLPTAWAIKNTDVGVFEPTPAIIVDLWDRHHPVLRQRSRDRLNAYLEAGFRLPIEFPTELDQYLATRAPLESIK
jgi:hypothetical protein